MLAIQCYDQLTSASLQARGTVRPPAIGSWHHLSLTTVKNTSFGSFDGVALFSKTPIRNIDAGFAVLATVQ